jgi:hypothetical protein
MEFTIKNVFKLLRLSIIGVPFLYFGVKECINDYQIDKRIDLETYVDSGIITNYSYQELPSSGGQLASAQARVTFDLTNNKSFYSDNYMPILIHADFDTTLYNGGQKAIFKVSRNKERAGIHQFVELRVGGKQLLSIEEGESEYKKSEYKYFLLIFGLLFTVGTALVIYFFVKEKR